MTAGPTITPKKSDCVYRAVATATSKKRRLIRHALHAGKDLSSVSAGAVHESLIACDGGYPQSRPAISALPLMRIPTSPGRRGNTGTNQCNRSFSDQAHLRKE